MTKEEAVAAVEAAFKDAHRSVQAALMDALQLQMRWLKAGDVIGVHPDETAWVTAELADAAKHLSAAIGGVATAHTMAADLRDNLAADGLLPPAPIVPLGGGGGKAWP